MGRIDFSYFAGDGVPMAFYAPWLLLAVITVLAVAAYAAAVRTRARSDSAARQD